MNVLEFLKTLNSTTVEEYKVKDILREYDIPVPKYIIFKDGYKPPDLSYPLVLKVSDPKILHKTEVGGVILGINDEQSLKQQFITLKQRFPQSDILVEEMQKPGIEVIIGVIDDPSFGLTLMFGMGGIYTELYRDVTFRLIPIDKIDAEDMLQDIRAKAIFEGFRGIKVYRAGIIDLLLKISKMAEDLQEYISQLDLNPVFVRENDLVVVDAKMLLKTPHFKR